MVRELAGHDLGRYSEVLRYPAGEALKAFEHRLQQSAREEYRTACQVWAALAATGAIKRKRPPDLPAILKE